MASYVAEDGDRLNGSMRKARSLSELNGECGFGNGRGLKSPVVKRFVSLVLRVQFDAIDRSVFSDVRKSRCTHANNELFSILYTDARLVTLA